MANLKGEVTFKVTFNNLGVPASMYSSGIIYKECAQQVYASAPWSSIGTRRTLDLKLSWLRRILKEIFSSR